MPMLQSCNKPRASCAAASRRLAPRCRMALLPRPAGEAATTAPMHVSRQHPMQQLQQGTSRGRPAPSRLAPARCCGTGTGARASGTFAADGEGRGGRDLQPPAGDKAGSGDSSPKQPTDAGAHPADAKASRQQQAAEMVLPLLQEALRPLVEGQADLLEAFEVSQQQQLAAAQRQEELLRQLLATASAAPGVPSPGAAIAAAIQVAPWQIVMQAPKLLDYVRLSAPSALDGIVLGTTKGRARVKVWSLSGPDHIALCKDVPPLMEVVAEGDLPRSTTRVQYPPYDPERKGVPVTRFTAAPGMLVRRGYHVREGEEREAAAGEVGVLQPSPDMRDTCLVEWASGSQGTYDTGNDGRFELVHLETSRTSGAGVVGAGWSGLKFNSYELLWEGHEKQPAFLSVSLAVGGTAVERGSHWTYGGAEPGVGSIVQPDQKQTKPGLLSVYWPNGQRVWHRTSPAHGYDLCYSARPGDPVTLFTAREGLKVETTAAGGARVLLGVLVRPEGIRGQAVLWQVKLLGFANTVTYAVEASESTPESGSPDVAGLRFF